MKRFLLLAIAVTGCSKVDIHQPQAQVVPISVPASQIASQGAKSTQDRIVEIDRLLSAPLTGNPEDANLRATLRAERAVLSGGGSNQRTNIVVNNSFNSRSNQQNSRSQRQQNQVPLVTVAQDSTATKPRVSGDLEWMLPSERERYFKELRLKNPNPVYAVPVESRRR